MFKYKFQHYVDVSTSASSMTVLQIKAGGDYAMNRMKHLWGAFKYVKMGRVSVKFLPASTLPVDPTGLSYDASDPQTVDPRDQMNPGLVRITNGEDIKHDFTGVVSNYQDLVYRNTMLDPRWSKFMLQRGFSRSAIPLYWTVGQLSQDVFPGSVTNIPKAYSSDHATRVWSVNENHEIGGTGSGQQVDDPTNVVNNDSTEPRGFFQTGHKGRLGWMPTDAFEQFYDHEGNSFEQPMVQPLPSVDCITCILPRAFKTLYFYRLYITETYYFSGIKNTGVYTTSSGNGEVRALDNFLFVPTPVPEDPSVTVNISGLNARPFGYPYPRNNGINDV